MLKALCYNSLLLDHSSQQSCWMFFSKSWVRHQTCYCWILRKIIIPGLFLNFFLHSLLSDDFLYFNLTVDLTSHACSITVQLPSLLWWCNGGCYRKRAVCVSWVQVGVGITVHKMTQTHLLSFSPTCLLQSTRDSGALGSATKRASGALIQFWRVSVACFIIHKRGESREGVYGTGTEAVRTSWPFAVKNQLMLGWCVKCKLRLG